MRLIDADEIRWADHYDSDGNLSKYKVAYSDEMPPTVDAVPLEWIIRRIEGLNIQAEKSTDDNKWAEFAREAFALEKIVKFWAERQEDETD